MSLVADSIDFAYDTDAVLRDLSITVEPGITGIVGPNACGKSTLLRTLARLLKPDSGGVILDGAAIHSMPTREVGRRLGILPQHGDAPRGVTVADLVRRGRYPHSSFLTPFSRHDEEAVENALELTGLTDLRNRAVDELSGGQRQRTWIAMILAQETQILLLDEPTTYLDLAHKRDTLALLRRLHVEHGRTIVAVLHDVNDAARLCDRIVAIRDGAIVADDRTGAVLTPEVLAEVFGVACDTVAHPHGGSIVLPRSTPDAHAGPPVSGSRGADRAPGRRHTAAGRRHTTPTIVGDSSMAPSQSNDALVIRGATGGYRDRVVLNGVDLEIPGNAVTAIVGPNGCGKSTLLRAIAGVLPDARASISIGEARIDGLSRREFARAVSLLEQSVDPPLDITVEELVMLGRHSHARWYRQWSRDDRQVLEATLSATGLTDLGDTPVGALSGGQLRRASLAMSLAQQARVVLLDEPTSFLDIAHQIELLELIRRRHVADGTTFVMVLHDVWQACRYADHIVVMESGRVVHTGAPDRDGLETLIADAFGVECASVIDPQSGRRLIVPGDVGSVSVAADGGRN